MSLVADPSERLLDPEATRPVLRLRFAGLLVVSFVINAIFLFALLHEAFVDDVSEAMNVEIPVELAPETPNAPEPPPPEEQPRREEAAKPPEPQNTLDEKPAFDAPRAANQEKIEREAPDDATRSPRQATTAAQAGGQPDPDAKPQASPDRTPEVAATPSAPERPDDRPDAEPLQPAEQIRKEAAKPDSRTKTKAPSKKGTLSNEELLAAFAPMPEFEIGGGADQTPVAGGKAKSTYLTVLFGLIMPRMQTPVVARGAQRRYDGVVTFYVNGWGGITRIGLSRPSGSAELDAAAVAAVRNAAPFSPPPGHRPLSLNFTYGSK